MTWFEELTGIDEQSPEQVRESLSIDDKFIVCPSGKRISFGQFETPKLAELRDLVDRLRIRSRPSTIREVVGDVRQLHADPTNAYAFFQVASQFNLLEMTSPSVTPERGIGIYENDHTQGPACAIACGGGTIYRNYFADVDGQVGQTSEKQIDCSADLGHRLGNINGRLWSVQNGYLFPTDHGLDQISTKLQMMSVDEMNVLSGELRIGLQWQADVTIAASKHQVSQAYCSALPVAYGRQKKEQWAEFAQLILDAAYEATLAAAVINAAKSGVNRVFVTLLGGGVFGNDDGWITAAIERAFCRHAEHGLDVRIVSYGQSNPVVSELVARLGSQRPTRD